ncbi:MAG TPA: AAA domain-containing protein [Opitutaceae bacterium]|nr:AAA domain-containing protein [Opitutaceae bacterium]
MILRTMLQRLYAGLASGPGLNAKPHSSRQRIDLLELRHLGGGDATKILPALLANGGREVDIAAKISVFRAPEFPECEWSDEQKKAKSDYERQVRLMGKLRDIAEDARDYFNDYGEHALYIGYPLLSIPPRNDRQGALSNRVLAPVAFTPVNLSVRTHTKVGLTISPAAGGADLVQPNPALLAWIEQQTGISTETLFADETGEDPWREIAEVLALLTQAAGLPAGTVFSPETPLVTVPKTEQLPDSPNLLSCAVLGLFPLGNPGLMRDTKWMIEQEPALQNPVRSFLSNAALDAPAPDAAATSDEAPPVSVQPIQGKDFSQEFLVTHADPCQAEAVARARRSAALVIHGPPGTGKSQTIANIIGDHLARGERVLFVCDKRTAIDVVKYRLDAMGLGSLCGVIHDAQRDRKDLYMSLRDKLENLTQTKLIADPEPKLAVANRRLQTLHAELHDYFQKLHASGESSFHELCGQWLEASSRSSTAIENTDDSNFSAEDLREHRADCEEVSARAIKANWETNPFRGRLEISLSHWMAKNPDEPLLRLKAAAADAVRLDETLAPDLPALHPARPALQQAQEFEALAKNLDETAALIRDEDARAFAASADRTLWKNELDQLAPHAEALNHPLDRELFLLVRDQRPTLVEVSQRIVSLDTWRPIADRFSRHLAFGKKNAAKEALSPLALNLDAASTDRARDFYAGLRARYLWCDLSNELLAQPIQGIGDDTRLKSLRDGLPKLLALAESARALENEQVVQRLESAFKNFQAEAARLAAALRAMAERARRIAQLETRFAETTLLSSASIARDSMDWRAGRASEPLCASFITFAPTLDESVRLLDRIGKLPAALRAPMTQVAERELPWNETEPALTAAAIARELRRRLKEDESIGVVDTQRVEAAFSELAERTREKAALVREKILFLWQQRWRARFTQGLPPKLNSAAANLRQRLFVKGQKALKLRQMIAAGATAEGGDPLFDLCPVWMAGPATVSQIFPREPLFDVVVFDEASQCRLEEALPVLLRAKRVVIAGDPKQLPPTRFFEKAVAESEADSPEDAEEIFEQQQSSAEDLLAAALNLDVEEAFLDVHYRSRNEALIGFSNSAFYGSRLQPIPGHPKNKALEAPIRLIRVDGDYVDRSNPAEAQAAVELVADLLAEENPPSIGLACFNLNQRDLILEALDAKADKDRVFAERLEAAKNRRGKDSFEGLFVKNLENVQGDERDHMIISTTFGLTPAPARKFNRNFGALSRPGGERRLNVLVTRARAMVHVLTSIPRSEYFASDELTANTTAAPNGRQQLYAYLRYAEKLAEIYHAHHDAIDASRSDKPTTTCDIGETRYPSSLAEALGVRLQHTQAAPNQVYWGNDGFCVDVALTHPQKPFDVTVGILTDFTRYARTPDPISWEQFRARVLADQGWQLHRVWSPALFRNLQGELQKISQLHEQGSR